MTTRGGRLDIIIVPLQSFPEKVVDKVRQPFDGSVLVRVSFDSRILNPNRFAR